MYNKDVVEISGKQMLPARNKDITICLLGSSGKMESGYFHPQDFKVYKGWSCFDSAGDLFGDFEN